MTLPSQSFFEQVTIHLGHKEPWAAKSNLTFVTVTKYGKRTVMERSGSAGCQAPSLASFATSGQPRGSDVSIWTWCSGGHRPERVDVTSFSPLPKRWYMKTASLRSLSRYGCALSQKNTLSIAAKRTCLDNCRRIAPGSTSGPTLLLDSTAVLARFPGGGSSSSVAPNGPNCCGFCWAFWAHATNLDHSSFSETPNSSSRINR
mmetsp:Transcript_10365/g.20842  ORF Transcript_10365/g.20842 Transcript_10365/m.20842 type:complete len:203 (-) Transcript_10365:429-1037(-)